MAQRRSTRCVRACNGHRAIIMVLCIFEYNDCVGRSPAVVFAAIGKVRANVVGRNDSNWAVEVSCTQCNFCDSSPCSINAVAHPCPVLGGSVDVGLRGCCEFQFDVRSDVHALLSKVAMVDAEVARADDRLEQAISMRRGRAIDCAAHFGKKPDQCLYSGHASSW